LQVAAFDHFASGSVRILGSPVKKQVRANAGLRERVSKENATDYTQIAREDGLHQERAHSRPAHYDFHKQ